MRPSSGVGLSWRRECGRPRAQFSTNMTMDENGLDLKMNGSGRLRTEVCAMCSFSILILMGGARPMTGYVRVLVKIYKAGDVL